MATLAPDRLLEPQPGSLLEEAFEASERGCESLAAFVTRCMTNDDSPTQMPRCLLEASDMQGPKLVALSSVRRIVGVGPKTEITEDHDAFYGNIERIEKDVAEGLQPAPFIIKQRDDGWYYLLDGNHTKMALQRHNFSHWWAIVLESRATCQFEEQNSP
jgi:hypothetical protein